MDELETRRSEIEQSLGAEPASPVRLHPNLAQVYNRQVERLQQALDHPEIRDEAVQILRGLVEHVPIGPAESGLEIEVVGEIAKMAELASVGASFMRSGSGSWPVPSRVSAYPQDAHPANRAGAEALLTAIDDDPANHEWLNLPREGQR